MATQEDDLDRAALVSHDIAPGASPESPLGNNFPYQDLRTNLRYNAIAQGAGLGRLDTGRKQANASLSLFRGDARDQVRRRLPGRLAGDLQLHRRPLPRH